MGENNVALAVVAAGIAFELCASQDETAFVLRSKTDKLSAHLVGEDAIRFHADYKAIKLQFPDWQVDQMLAQLWDQGGYSWLAIEEAC